MTVRTGAADSLTHRKARGAFFTPPELCDYVVRWAIRSTHDRVLEPSCGEAAFLLSAARRLHKLGGNAVHAKPQLAGIEVHEESALAALTVLNRAGIRADITVADFFTVEHSNPFDAVVGNPPYVRYQDFTGEARARGRAAALRSGVPLTGLASSWAPFVVHAASFLKPQGRLGLVLPAELLTVNYAAEVRRFLMQRFSRVRLVLFTERVFPGVLEEVVLLLAEGQGPTDHCELYQVRDTDDLKRTDELARRWKPPTPDGKWTPSLMPSDVLDTYVDIASGDAFGTLHDWGETTLGMVTGNNRFFALSPERATALRLTKRDLVSLSPPGSRHLRDLTFSTAAWRDLGRTGRATMLFRPLEEPSEAASRYIKTGEEHHVHQAYKCRVRTPWWRVPLLPPADLLLTYMNADTPRICANRARVRHLNSVHGVYVRPGMRRTAMDLLPLASLNSMTLLGAETVGRAYGGGMLKLEPKEADQLPLPNEMTLVSTAPLLSGARRQIATSLRRGRLSEAVRLVDDILLVAHLGMRRSEVRALTDAHAEMRARRLARGNDRRAKH